MSDAESQNTEEARATAERLERTALDRSAQALRLVSASLPHLSGLTRLARLKASRHVPVAAVAASGLTLVRPDLFAKMPLADAAFVLAHELMHLALDTHGRSGDAHPLLVNFAHDYVINDILREELHRDPPLDGLNMHGARERSLEELVVDLSQTGAEDGALQCWGIDRVPRQQKPAASPMSRALEDAGLVEPPTEPEPSADPGLMRGDLLPGHREAEFEPEITPELRRRLTQQVRQQAAKAASLSALKTKIDAAQQPSTVSAPERGEAMMQALRDAYHTPWELALQRWMDAAAPGERTYSRPSRRVAMGSNVVRPGRRREGWTLHIVLDTSGSMEFYLPRALGAIAAFCDASGVIDIHVVQCDTEVTNDRWIDTAELADFKVVGFGWSDMTPAMQHLADDPEVTAVLLLTDGYIEYMHDEPPYRVLWALLGEFDPDFAPPYGEVIHVRTFES